MSTTQQVSVTTCFVDLATFSELEGFMYGGPNAVTWFVASVQKSNWFSFIPTTLRFSGVIDFGQKNVSASINRSGDYVLSVWFRAQIPLIQLYQTLGVGTASPIYDDATIRWSRNLMHNLMEYVSLTFNELVAHEFNQYWLDNNFQFRVRGSKRVGYRNMIGDISAMTNPVGPNIPLGTGGYFSCILPFFFGEDSGIALPVAALPFNDIKINFQFRQWEHLLVVYPGTAAVGNNGVPGTGRAATVNDIYIYGSTSQKPQLQDPLCFAHYVVVHNDERVKMGDAPRDMLIHQVQFTQPAPFKDISTRNSFDIRFSHAIVCFMYEAQNTSIYEFGKGMFGAEWSNYTTEPNYAGLDPIAYSTLLYENTPRLALGSDYFSLVHPFLFSKAVPDETGYHMWSYALHPWNPTQPSASTNYSKLANVSIQHDMSPAAIAAAGIGTPGNVPLNQYGNPIQWPNTSGVLTNMPLTLRHVFVAKNDNISRVANGSFGFPTL